MRGLNPAWLILQWSHPAPDVYHCDFLQEVKWPLVSGGFEVEWLPYTYQNYTKAFYLSISRNGCEPIHG